MVHLAIVIKQMNQMNSSLLVTILHDHLPMSKVDLCQRRCAAHSLAVVAVASTHHARGFSILIAFETLGRGLHTKSFSRARIHKVRALVFGVLGKEGCSKAGAEHAEQ